MFSLVVTHNLQLAMRAKRRVRIADGVLEENESSSRPRVAGIMRELGLQGKRKGTVKQKTTDSKHSHAIAENKLERKFDVEKPNRAWVADLTYIPTLEGWLFLAIVIDLFSRKRPKPEGAAVGVKKGTAGTMLFQRALLQR